MILTFANFTLNSEIKELYFNNEKVSLTKQNYDLLLFFLNNHGAVVSKDEIIEKVWNGKIVTHNTVDKSFTKLKKVLNQHQQMDYFESQYGFGMKFLPEVSISDGLKKPTDNNPKKKTNPVSLLAILVVFLAIFAYISSNQSQQKTPIPIKQESNQKPLLLILPNETDSDNTQWWSANNDKLIEQILGDYHNTLIKDYKTKPPNLNKQQYLEHQWKISPQLKVLSTNIVKENDIYTLDFKLTDNNLMASSFTTSHKNFNNLYSQANKWLLETLHQDEIKISENALPNNQVLIENYLRGLSDMAIGENEKAAHYFEICLIEDSTFHLARLALAEVKNTMGQQQQALATLDTLDSLDINTNTEINSQSLRGLILFKMGKPLLAKQGYLDTLEKFKDSEIFELNNILLNLSYVYTGLTENDKALEQMDKLIKKVSSEEFPEFIAEVYRKKASLLQKMGHTSLAKDSINKAKILFNQLGDLIGEAKVHTLLARLAQHEANYEEALEQLNHSLAIVRALKNKVGIGATISEIIYVQLTQGQFSKAWSLNQELESIANEIDYAFMQLASKQFTIDIARVQKQWEKAEIYLQQHNDLAISTNNERAKINNKLLAIDLYLDSHKIELIQSLIDELQSYINDKKEIRMQPRIDLKQARFYTMTDQADLAVSILQESYPIALETNDTESLIQINNQLARIHLDKNQPEEALLLLKKSEQYKPFSYPFDLLRSKAYAKKGLLIKAIELANQCKLQSNEFWQTDDNEYLVDLIKKNES